MTNHLCQPEPVEGNAQTKIKCFISSFRESLEESLMSLVKRFDKLSVTAILKASESSFDTLSVTAILKASESSFDTLSVTVLLKDLNYASTSSARQLYFKLSCITFIFSSLEITHEILLCLYFKMRR
jgi:hypothetical protein